MAQTTIRQKLGTNFQLEVVAENPRDAFAALAQYQEVLSETACGLCGNTDIHPNHRQVDGNDYYEWTCPKCRARLALGCNKVGGGLFPKRWDKESRQEIGKNGWVKFQRNQQAEQPAPRQQAPANNQTVDSDIPF